jgi:hypothetical protein
MVDQTNSVHLSKRVFDRIKSELCPELRIVNKAKLRLHLLANWLLNLVYPASAKDTYLENVWVYFWRTVIVPTGARWDDSGSVPINWMSLGHEYMHLLQEKKWGCLLFYTLYFFPVSLGVILLLTSWLPLLWASGWVLACWVGAWVLGAIVCFMPGVPAPWRKMWELEAYSATMLFFAMASSSYCVPTVVIEEIAGIFTSLTYWKMATSKNRIQSRLQLEADAIKNGTSHLYEHPVIKIIAEEFNRQDP